jgi:signal transduction histidine kinase
LIPASPREPAPLRWLKRGMVAAIALPLFFFAVAAWLTWRYTLEDAGIRLQHTAVAGQEHAMRVLELSEVIASDLRRYIQDMDDATIRRREREIHEWLRDSTLNLEYVMGIWVIDARGVPLAGSRFHPTPQLDVADRNYFKWHRQNRGSVFVSGPFTSRTTGELVFDVSFRREADDGSFNGIISVALYPEYFSRVYARLLAREPSFHVALLLDDGTVLGRAPQSVPGFRFSPDGVLMREVSRRLPEGKVEGPSEIDGVVRVAAYQRLDRFPLLVASAVNRQALVDAWARRLAVLAGFTFPPSLALVYMCWLALRRTRRLHSEAEQRRQAEQALVEAQKLEALGRLTGGVAHDFNNLLMVVSNNQYLLKLPGSPEEAAASHAAIERAVAAGTRLTKELLAFARQRPERPTVLRLQEWLGSMDVMLRPAVGGTVTLTLEVEPETASVFVDRSALELALVNLAMNAADAIEGPGTLRVSARNARTGEGPVPGRLVVIEVRDSGVGIPEPLQPKVFEPFFTTKPVGKGTGLGLSQVYGFCRQAGGTATVDSAPGRGTTIRLYLPASSAVPANDPGEAREARPPHGTRVLLVEDNADLARATQKVLESLGCVAKRAATADEARGLLAGSGDYDVVLSDVVMPGNYSGIDLRRWIAATHPRLPVILMTGYAALAGGQETGEVLRKPLMPRDLGAALAAAVIPNPTPRRNRRVG